jgi:hypothetical protein
MSPRDTHHITMITAITIKNEIDIHGQSAGPVFLSVDDGAELKVDRWMLYSEAQKLAGLFGLPLYDA